MIKKYKQDYKTITLNLHITNDDDIIKYLGKHPKTIIAKLIRKEDSK